MGGSAPLQPGEPRANWPIQTTERSAYHSEPRNPYQTEEENSVQAFVNKYLSLADVALAAPVENKPEQDASSKSDAA